MQQDKKYTMGNAKTIVEVIAILDKIISDSIQQNSRMGYFACLYRKMTIAVKEGIDDGVFEDSARMERLDVIFANRYLDAYYQYSKKSTITQSWRYTFDASTQHLATIQHLFLGMNAHINLDLGIAAAEISKDGDIHILKNDFDKINEVIGSLINSVQSNLEDICFPMRFVRLIDHKSKDAVINFSMKIARDTAWGSALALSVIPENDWDDYISILDNRTAQVAQNIKNPKLLGNIVLKLVRFFEPKSVTKIIAHLKN